MTDETDRQGGVTVVLTDTTLAVFVQGVGTGLALGAFFAPFGLARPTAIALGLFLLLAGYLVEHTETAQGGDS